jgi:hypothetical protein
MGILMTEAGVKGHNMIQVCFGISHAELSLIDDIARLNSAVEQQLCGRYLEGVWISLIESI